MKTLAEWVRNEPLGRKDAVGWAVRIVKALLVLHDLDVPHGRINAHSVVAEAPACESRGALLDGDEIKRDVQFYSVQRIKLSGASKEDDVWAVGVLLYFMVTGAYPFPGTHRRQIRERIEWRPASPIEVFGVEDPPLQALVDRIFKPDEALRLVAPKLLLRALLRLEPEAESLSELGPVAPRPEPKRSGEVVSSSGELPIEDPDTDVVDSVQALLGSADGSSSPLTEGQIPRGPMATLPRMALSPVESPQRPEPSPAQTASGPALPSATAPRPRPESPRTGRGRRKGMSMAVGLWSMVALLAVVALALYLVPELREGVVDMVVGDAEPPATKAPAFAPPAPTPSASEPEPDRPAKGPVAGEGLDACVADLFPDDSFIGSKPRFDFVCAEDDPRKVADSMRVEIVLGKGTRTVTEAMKIWTELGWHKLAFVAAARARCCGADAPPLKSELGGPPCRFDHSLSDLGHAAVHGDEAHLDKALADFQGAVDCLAEAPTEDVYGFGGPVSGEEPKRFREAIAPLRSAQN